MARRSRSDKHRLDFYHHDIPTKANRVLNIILVAMILILIRIWHLAIIQYDQKLEESRKPQRKVVIEPATRATIRDRFNLPLAINKIHYQAAILYSQLIEIPSIAWKQDSHGKKIKVFKRKEYIKQLAQLLGEELNLDAERVEDLIHSKASYYAQVPFVIKEELTEKEYYRLKMLEREWPGIYVRRLPQRYYPRGRVAADVLGYMGSINRQEYEKILHEIKVIEQFIKDKEEGLDPELPPGVENSMHARTRLRDLEEKAYTIHDYIGKTGIEGVFEEQLRGFYGKKSFYSDSKGIFLRELPGSRAPLSGHRILLTISAELQEYAEQLLAQNEQFRIVRMSHLDGAKQTILALKHPWIKGGGIVVLDPHTGEVLTLASYPRFDPNDFIASGNPEMNRDKHARINRWFENETYIANMWDQQQPLERERYDDQQPGFYDEKCFLKWETYLDFVLPLESALRKTLAQVRTLEQVIFIQKEIDALQVIFPAASLYSIFNFLYADPPHLPHRSPLTQAERQSMEKSAIPYQEHIHVIKTRLDPYLNALPQNYDKVLFVDLCRLTADHDRFSSQLMQKVGQQSVTMYHDMIGHFVTLTNLLKQVARELYHDFDFANWRKQEEKNFLKQKRLEEKASKTHPKPYLDYLDQNEQSLFHEFWEHYKWDLLVAFLMGNQEAGSFEEQLGPYVDYLNHWHQELQQGAYQAIEWRESYHTLQRAIYNLSTALAKDYLHTLRPYQELTRPLFGHYRHMKHSKSALEKDLAGAFYPLYGTGYGRSYAYRQAAIQGSIFKLVAAYEALVQNFKRLNRENVSIQDLNPFVIIDQVFQQGNVRYVGYTQDGKPIPQLYKGGRLPRSLAHRNNGRVDLIRALEVSSNPYFALLAGEYLEDPQDLPKAARLFSYGARTGIDLPAEIAGNVPTDVSTNRTGLYSLAIGQHSLVVTPLQTAVMLSAIANGGKVLKPKIVNLTAGQLPSRGEDQIYCPPSFPYQEHLALIGIDFPLFTALSLQDQKNLVKMIPTEVKREVFMPHVVRQILLKGLRASVDHTHQESLASLRALYHEHPEAIKSFIELKQQLIGKSSTSESVEHIDLDLNEGTNLYTHVWFGSIAFQSEGQDKNTFIFKDEFGQPELVVVIYLRFGGYGKEAAPLAAQIVKKWREIKNLHK